ncbi:MAG: response regulator transcription factor [Isosphaeraceae bacterium]
MDQGGAYLDPALAGQVLGNLVGGATTHAALSDREEEVLRLISRGLTNREIADQLDVSIKTIETHRARSMEKLGLKSRADIVAHAIRCGWLGDR